jgi:hypothetical protein
MVLKFISFVKLFDTGFTLFDSTAWNVNVFTCLLASGPNYLIVKARQKKAIWLFAFWDKSNKEQKRLHDIPA